MKKLKPEQRGWLSPPPERDAGPVIFTFLLALIAFITLLGVHCG